ncbi:DUF3127 domain-containing protein [Rhodohalobacter sp. SW132]|uniref:DUF3127 domain-containing protein n=1 Tax=Rhodohalobacter sp. SW132 TaxID=2293433 RepID=UPI000E26E9DD|nr:DUF3127 domain-containing protein [Rhodohalobacter sp. SW132]REL38717.1 DUF3127 domain-containing protein [Rhodohalobacter sp. SW132]
MDLKIAGKVVDILDVQSGESKNGPWKKRDFILETPGKYPRKVCVTQWGEQIDQTSLEAGEEITAFIDIQSREYNGRWYTDVKAWKIEKGAQSEDARPSPDENVIDLGPGGDDDGLPF